MNIKRNPKNIIKPNFWGDYEQKVPNMLKDFVFEQYLSDDTVFIYSDASASNELYPVAIACSFVENGSIMVKQQLVFPTEEMPYKNIYGELRAIRFALTICDKYIKFKPEKLVIYTDFEDIDAVISEEILFRKKMLRKVQKELIDLYQQKVSSNPNLNISIEYLQKEKRKHNPFHNAAHNAAIKMLRSQSKS